jgi:hypothetical protein
LIFFFKCISLDRPYKGIKNAVFRNLWKNIVHPVHTIRIESLFVLLIPYILSICGENSDDDSCDVLISSLFSSGETNSLKSEARTFLDNLKCALDISGTGAISALQLDRVTRHLPEKASLSQALAMLSYQASLVVLPTTYDNIMYNFESLIGDKTLQPRLNAFLYSPPALSASDQTRF